MVSLKNEESGVVEGQEALADLITKEIVATLNHRIQFRMKAAFTVWVAPFLIFGSLIIAQGRSISFVDQEAAVPWLILFFVCYLFLGGVAGKLEASNWRRGDDLRKLLLKTCNVKLSDNDKKLFINSKFYKWVLPTYIVVFSLIGISFYAILNLAALIKAS